ncbi:MAG: fasciclin domain-containing protein, partial [Gemmatimonadota bacterium]
MHFQRSARRLRAALLLPMLALGLAACGDDDDVGPTEPEGPGTLLEEARKDARLTSLVAALEAAGLDETIGGTIQYTVFAPDNQAFEGLPEGWVDNLLLPENEDVLTRILQYHVVTGEVLSTDLSDGQEITTVEGATLTVGIDAGNITLTDASGNVVGVVDADIEASNGVIHIIDDVFLPELDAVELAQIAGYGTLVALVEEAGLTETLKGEGPFTIFAPSDETLEGIVAEGDDLSALLNYHVVAGEALESGDLTDLQELTTVQGEILTIGVDAPQDAPVTVTVTDANGNTYEVVEPNLVASNAVIHGIEGVLVPESDIPTVAALYGYSSLVNAVAAAGLTEALQVEGPLTVFAPSNAAFESTPTQLPSEGELLEQFLTYHVVEGEFLSSDLTDGQELTTVEGSIITVGVNEETGAVTLTDAAGNVANVEVADIRTSNGVIHGVDAVLVPSLSVPVLATYYGFSTLAGALGTATLEGTPLAEILADEEAAYTVFAPTNEAFEAFGTLPEGDDLTRVLLYHVVEGTLDSGRLVAGDLDTVQGDFITVSIDAPQDAPVTVTLTDGLGNT